MLRSCILEVVLGTDRAVENTGQSLVIKSKALSGMAL